MIVKQIDMNDEGMPSTLTVRMTVREAALIARMIGKTNGTMRNEVQHDGSQVGSEVYDCLSGEFFNRFWDDGVDGVPR